ncbi:MAG: cytochrome c [Nitrospiraceae bacterium]|nr:cytochrome c [Nitrospiraceae bacterium]
MIKRVDRVKSGKQKKDGFILWVGVVIGIMMAGLAVAEAADIEKGKALYRQSCGHCHGLDGKGDGEVGGYLNPPPANLASEQTQSQSDADLKAVIMNGRSGTAMVGFEGALDEAQFADLLAYLRSLKP